MVLHLQFAFLRGEVAQLVEHTAENRGVAGSIPALAIFSRSPKRARKLDPESFVANGSGREVADDARPRR